MIAFVIRWSPRTSISCDLHLVEKFPYQRSKKSLNVIFPKRLYDISMWYMYQQNLRKKNQNRWVARFSMLILLVVTASRFVQGYNTKSIFLLICSLSFDFWQVSFLFYTSKIWTPLHRVNSCFTNNDPISIGNCFSNSDTDQ